MARVVQCRVPRRRPPWSKDSGRQGWSTGWSTPGPRAGPRVGPRRAVNVGSMPKSSDQMRQPTHVDTDRADAAGSPPGCGHQLADAVRDGAEERSGLVQPGKPDEARPSDLESRIPGPSVPYVVAPANPPRLNEAAAAVLLGILIRAS